MNELRYSSLDVAVIVSTFDLGCKEESALLNNIWEQEQDFLQTKYQNNQRNFILDVRYWMDYLVDKEIIDKEFPAIQKDLAANHSTITDADYICDFTNLDLFFKSIRIRILYGNGNGYIRMKLRTLLRQYGYKRRSPQLVQHINRCMHFYHIGASLRGGVPCNIAKDALDNIVIFRII